MTRPDQLERLDGLRFSTMARRHDGDRRQEWQHFIIHGNDGHIIVNFSVSDRGEGQRPLARVVVIVDRAGEWAGWQDEYEFEEVEFGTQLSAGFGQNKLALGPGGYELRVKLDSGPVHGRLRFMPMVGHGIKHNTSLGSGRFNWLYVPSLRVDGHLWADGVRFSIVDGAGYHDHNWGVFDWSGDFGWMWGTAHARFRSERWSFVFWRMSDRGHLVNEGQGLGVWRDGHEGVVFRDSELDYASSGLLGRPPALFIPSVAGLIHGGSASDLPQRLRVKASRGGDTVSLLGRVGSYARLMVPSHGSERGAVLHEASLAIEAEGHIEGRYVEMEGTGVLEVLR